jgi:hypothetical protein
MSKNVRSSTALREARGTGLERPEPAGEKTCWLAAESAAMLCEAGDVFSIVRWQITGHAAPGGSDGEYSQWAACVVKSR